jgi:hypothetical protein
VYVPPPPPAVVVTPPPAHHATPPPAQPVPPPPPRMLSEGEAINIGIRYCQSHAYACDLKESHLTGDGVWKVTGPELPAGARVRVTAVSGTVLIVIPA